MRALRSASPLLLSRPRPRLSAQCHRAAPKCARRGAAAGWGVGRGGERRGRRRARGRASSTSAAKKKKKTHTHAHTGEWAARWRRARASGGGGGGRGGRRRALLWAASERDAGARARSARARTLMTAMRAASALRASRYAAASLAVPSALVSNAAAPAASMPLRTLYIVSVCARVGGGREEDGGGRGRGARDVGAVWRVRCRRRRVMARSHARGAGMRKRHQNIDRYFSAGAPAGLGARARVRAPCASGLVPPPLPPPHALPACARARAGVEWKCVAPKGGRVRLQVRRPRGCVRAHSR